MPRSIAARWLLQPFRHLQELCQQRRIEEVFSLPFLLVCFESPFDWWNNTHENMSSKVLVAGLKRSGMSASQSNDISIKSYSDYSDHNWQEGTQAPSNWHRRWLKLTIRRGISARMSFNSDSHLDPTPSACGCIWDLSSLFAFFGGLEWSSVFEWIHNTGEIEINPERGTIHKSTKHRFHVRGSLMIPTCYYCKNASSREVFKLGMALTGYNKFGEIGDQKKPFRFCGRNTTNGSSSLAIYRFLSAPYHLGNTLSWWINIRPNFDSPSGAFILIRFIPVSIPRKLSRSTGSN